MKKKKSPVYKMTFKQYFETLSESEKKKRIGDVRYNAYRAGLLKIDRFMDVPASARLTISEVMERDEAAFKKG